MKEGGTIASEKQKMKEEREKIVKKDLRDWELWSRIHNFVVAPNFTTSCPQYK